MQGLLEIATKISTPLMLGGLIVIALLIIFRIVVVPNFIPQLTKGQGARILTIIVVGFFALAMVAAVLGIITYQQPVETKPPDAYVTNLPPGITFRQAVEHIARTDGKNFLVDFGKCSGDVLAIAITGGQISGTDGGGAIDNLRLMTASGKEINYTVNRNSGGRRYEIVCW